MTDYQPDPQRLTPEQRDKLESYQQAQDTLKTLSDIADMTQELINIADSDKKSDEAVKKQFGTLLVDIRESLQALNDKETAEMPDVTKPIKDLADRLEKAIKAIDVKPVVNVPDAPEPTIDTSGIEKLLKSEVPKAFQEAIKAMPKVDIPKTDNSELLAAWAGIAEQLDSIDIATRMKPQPGSMQATQKGAWDVGTALIKGPIVGQTTASTTAVRLYGGTIPVTNGIFVQALSTNTVSVFVGGSDVKTTTGYELQAGQCIPFTVDDIRDLFVISVSGSPAVCWSVA